MIKNYYFLFDFKDEGTIIYVLCLNFELFLPTTLNELMDFLI